MSFFSVCFNKKAKRCTKYVVVRYNFSISIRRTLPSLDTPNVLPLISCISRHSAPNFPTHSSRRSFVSGHAQQIFLRVLLRFLCRRLVLVLFKIVFVVVVFVFQNIIFLLSSLPGEKTNKTRKFPTPPRTRRRRRKDAPRQEGGTKGKIKTQVVIILIYNDTSLWTFPSSSLSSSSSSSSSSSCVCLSRHFSRQKK